MCLPHHGAFASVIFFCWEHFSTLSLAKTSSSHRAQPSASLPSEQLPGFLSLDQVNPLPPPLAHSIYLVSWPHMHLSVAMLHLPVQPLEQNLSTLPSSPSLEVATSMFVSICWHVSSTQHRAWHAVGNRFFYVLCSFSYSSSLCSFLASTGVQVHDNVNQCKCPFPPAASCLQAIKQGESD